MGSSTDIGFVYHSNHYSHAEKELSAVIKFLIRNNGKMLSQKYCRDLDGNGWVEEDEIAHLFAENVSGPLVSNYHSRLDMQCDILGKKGLHLHLYFKRLNESNFGILLDIADKDILGADLDPITEEIILLIREVYNFSHFAYSFCDNEAQIEYSLPELLSIGRPVYSIVAMPSEQSLPSLLISKSSWNIDGLTPRNR